MRNLYYTPDLQCIKVAVTCQLVDNVVVIRKNRVEDMSAVTCSVCMNNWLRCEHGHLTGYMLYVCSCRQLSTHNSDIARKPDNFKEGWWQSWREHCKYCQVLRIMLH